MAVLLGLGHLVINTDKVFPEQFSTVIFPGCSNECNTVTFNSQQNVLWMKN